MEYAGLKYREKGGATKAGAHSSYKSFMSLNCPQTLPLRKVPHFHLSEKKNSFIHPSIHPESRWSFAHSFDLLGKITAKFKFLLCAPGLVVYCIIECWVCMLFLYGNCKHLDGTCSIKETYYLNTKVKALPPHHRHQIRPLKGFWGV